MNKNSLSYTILSMLVLQAGCLFSSCQSEDLTANEMDELKAAVTDECKASLYLISEKVGGHLNGKSLQVVDYCQCVVRHAEGRSRDVYRGLASTGERFPVNQMEWRKTGYPKDITRDILDQQICGKPPNN